MARDGWMTSLAKMVDDRLRDLSKSLKRKLRLLRFLVFVMVLLWLGLVAVAVGAIVWPEYQPYFFAFAVIVLSLPFLGMTIGVALPLRAKSITRLIDKGYPENAKEIAIRLAARKLHEESIETEELLVDTAINETRKAIRKYKAEAAEKAAQEQAPPPPPSAPPSSPPPPPREPDDEETR